MDQQQELIKAIEDIGDLIGNTHLEKFSNNDTGNGCQIYAKLEWQQLGGSVKARPAYNIIKQALMAGELTPNKILIDASSGNTGIAYAAIGRKIGIKVEICLPSNASRERIDILKKLNATIRFTSPFGGTDEAQLIAKKTYESRPGLYFYADQYANNHNWEAHYATTAEEIFDETKGKITHFVAGLGTTGTMMGTGRRLKELNPSIKLIGLQPEAALHGLEGWKHLDTAIVPKIYNPSLLDEVITIYTEEAYDLIRDINVSKQLLLSPSSAANLVGAQKVAANNAHRVVVTVFPDDVSKYGDVLKQIFETRTYAA